MSSFRATKCITTLDIVFLFLSQLGILIWNDLHAEKDDKYFPDFGEVTWYVGIGTSLMSLELDIFLLYFVHWELETALQRWNYACLGFAFLSWISYIAVTMYVKNLYLAIWAFFFLYSRAMLIMISKAEYIAMTKSNIAVKKLVPQNPSVPELTSRTSVSTPTPTTTFRLQTMRNETEKPSTSFLEKLGLGDGKEQDYGNATDEVKLAFCTFLGPQPAPDHYMARNESMIKVNEERHVEELKTKM